MTTDINRIDYTAEECERHALALHAMARVSTHPAMRLALNVSAWSFYTRAADLYDARAALALERES